MRTSSMLKRGLTRISQEAPPRNSQGHEARENHRSCDAGLAHMVVVVCGHLWSEWLPLLQQSPGVACYDEKEAPLNHNAMQHQPRVALVLNSLGLWCYYGILLWFPFLLVWMLPCASWLWRVGWDTGSSFLFVLVKFVVLVFCCGSLPGLFGPGICCCFLLVSVVWTLEP